MQLGYTLDRSILLDKRMNAIKLIDPLFGLIRNYLSILKIVSNQDI